MERLNPQESNPVENSLQFKTLSRLIEDREVVESAYYRLKSIGDGEFKESKVRDENGELAIVWHGSSRIFEQFDEKAKGEFSWRNKGVHFQSSKDFVGQYAEKAFDSFRIAFHDIGREELGEGYDWRNSEHLTITAEAYNKLIEDLMENGEQSSYYNKHGDWGSVVFKRRKMDMEWFGEIFGGKLPTKEGARMLLGPGGNKVYFGKDVGRIYYAVVLNITNPYEHDTLELDFGFDRGEESHEQKGTDGTILYHHQNMNPSLVGEVDGTAKTTSYAIFERQNIKIIGREIDGIFNLTPEFISNS